MQKHETPDGIRFGISLIKEQQTNANKQKVEVKKMNGRERTIYDFVMNLITDKKIFVNDIVNSIHAINNYLNRYYNEPLNEKDENKLATKIIMDAVKMALLEV